MGYHVFLGLRCLVSSTWVRVKIGIWAQTIGDCPFNQPTEPENMSFCVPQMWAKGQSAAQVYG